MLYTNAVLDKCYVIYLCCTRLVYVMLYTNKDGHIPGEKILMIEVKELVSWFVQSFPVL
jgi:hypothetical protein